MQDISRDASHLLIEIYHHAHLLEPTSTVGNEGGNIGPPETVSNLPRPVLAPVPLPVALPALTVMLPTLTAVALPAGAAVLGAGLTDLAGAGLGVGFGVTANNLRLPTAAVHGQVHGLHVCDKVESADMMVHPLRAAETSQEPMTVVPHTSVQLLHHI